MASQSIYAPRQEQSYSSTGPLDQAEEDEVPVHPYLTQPLLYISNLDASLSDKELAATVFSACLPIRLRIDRPSEVEAGTQLNGTVEFQTLDKAEKALATIQTPLLSIYKDANQDPKPTSKPRLVKQLPHGIEDGDIYDLFRPYGAIHSTSRILTNPAGQITGFRGMATIVYYHEEEAQRAQVEMHCAEVEGKTISVTIDTTPRRPVAQTATSTGFSAAATPFVPQPASSSSPLKATAQPFSPSGKGAATSIYAPVPAPAFVAPAAYPHPAALAATNASVVDPCNLFCKNLDPSIESNELFALFKPYGKIVSARVMRDDRGVSREFGFVSFRRPEDASRAMEAMNGTVHGSKAMVVRLHEPKNVRQEKLSQKFGTAFQQEPLTDRGSVGLQSDYNESPSLSDVQKGETDELDLSQLQAMNATLRGDILRGGFSRKVKEVEGVTSDQVDELVSELDKLTLPEAVAALNDPQQLRQRIVAIQAKLPTKSEAPLPEGLQPASPLPADASERDRLLHALHQLEPAEQIDSDAVIHLLLGLPKKERALALFNHDFLRVKVDEARSIIALGDEEEAETGAVDAPPAPKQAPASNGQSAVPSSTISLSDLAKLPALEIIQKLHDSNASGLPLARGDVQVERDTDAFVDSLQGLPETERKQKMGDQLYKVIRTFGVKSATKPTIALIDGEDLRSLAHLMNSYPDCLRAKVAHMQASK